MQRAYWEPVAAFGNDGRNDESMYRFAVEGGWLYKFVPLHGTPSITFVPRTAQYGDAKFHPQSENTLDYGVPV